MIGLGEGRSSARESQHQDPPERRYAAHRLVEHVAPHRVVDDIGTASASKGFHLVTESVAVIDDMVCTHRPHDLKFLIRAGGADDLGAEQLAEVDRGQPDAAGGAVYQQRLAVLYVAALEAEQGRRVIVAKGCRCVQIHAIRNLRDGLRVDVDLFYTATRTEHLITRFQVRHIAAHLDHRAGPFTADGKRQG